jgi:hypothetical protein
VSVCVRKRTPICISANVVLGAIHSTVAGITPQQGREHAIVLSFRGPWPRYRSTALALSLSSAVQPRTNG